MVYFALWFGILMFITIKRSVQIIVSKAAGIFIINLQNIIQTELNNSKRYKQSLLDERTSISYL